MSRRLVSHSPDLGRLQAEGYDVKVHSNLLMVKVPYATADGVVAWGYLASELTVSGDTAMPPATHVVHFVGASEDDLPCDADGRPLDELINQRGPIPLGNGVAASCTFSHKPSASYADYYEKMSTYSDMLLSYAQVLDPEATPRTFPPVPTEDAESVFRYFDSATSRAGIGAASERLQIGKVVIVGVGGTGSYVLDAVAKTPVREIHIYDRDVLLTHNAFRTPGAVSLAELGERPRKVDYFQLQYDNIHRGITAHPVNVDETNVDEIGDADFVFVCIDSGPNKRFLIRKLEEFGIAFIDTGMGVYQKGSSLGGLVRTTASDDRQRNHVWENDRISFGDEEDDEYEQNIQLAELNMLNAALAVIKWKKMMGFYFDFDHEYSSVYTIDGNHVLNEDKL
ncbi:ThiF family adenylyltransferase [Streptomyces hokutonensis]|uniref:ThiF family adenylyltransferase n=1 Tax=Streptomyces hokutonensis TaxID=1306990 RepID=UPI00039FE46B|nr:ThiF family adenylyltransferase [Streptomyces hokutonensis]